MNIFDNKDYFLFDGAMGTYYSSRHDSNIACETANLTDRDAIYNIHKEYINAGVNAIKTNTFAANRFSLACEQAEVEQVIKSGWQIANRAVKNHNVTVFADIGPIPVTEGTDEEEEYKEIVDIFLDCGAEYFLFETFPKYDILLELSAYIRLRKPEALIITSFAVYPDGYSKEGLFYMDIFNKVANSGLIDAYGFNCISGPAHMCRLVSELDIKGKVVSIMPNSGYPSSERGRAVYVDNSEYFSGKILELKNLGVKILGGCCGTTPKHIAVTAGLLSSNAVPVDRNELQSDTVIKDSYREQLIQKLVTEKKSILVEIDPPFDTNWEYMLRDAFLLKQAGADMITISDSPLAKARADSAILAAKIQRETGVPVMPHITCRDKNLLGIKATLLGLSIEGIRNVLVVTGDPIANIERKDVKGVFSMNSSNLANYVSSLNTNIFGNASFEIGGALNVNAFNFEAELRRALKKIENGISYFLTQATYTETAVNNIIKAVEILKVPVFAGLMPIVSFRNAQFINNEVPGITIDEATIEGFRDKSREEAELLGIELAMKCINKLYEHVSGFYIMTPLKRTNIVCEIIKRIKEIEL
ncbi:MAG: methylenetetrahydrofolate reductase [Eubacterium sp.]|jgi:homocysteine S-methyltransferase|nr:methylenetetrahydrofolate reductase [Eubacterium sp.]